MVWPSTPLDIKGGLELTGGRNVVSIGGEYKVDTPWYLPEYNVINGVPTRQEAALTNRFLKISGVANTAPRTIHIEGLKVHAPSCSRASTSRPTATPASPCAARTCGSAGCGCSCRTL